MYDCTCVLDVALYFFLPFLIYEPKRFSSFCQYIAIIFISPLIAVSHPLCTLGEGRAEPGALSSLQAALSQPWQSPRSGRCVAGSGGSSAGSSETGLKSPVKKKLMSMLDVLIERHGLSREGGAGPMAGLRKVNSLRELSSMPSSGVGGSLANRQTNGGVKVRPVGDSLPAGCWLFALFPFILKSFRIEGMRGHVRKANV